MVGWLARVARKAVSIVLSVVGKPHSRRCGGWADTRPTPCALAISSLVTGCRSFDMVQVKDAQGHIFATRLSNVFVIGKGTKPMVSLPKRKGIKKTIMEERTERPPKQ